MNRERCTDVVPQRWVNIVFVDFERFLDVSFWSCVDLSFPTTFQRNSNHIPT